MFINWNHDIYITEGWFDANAIKRNAIPLLGKTIPNAIKSALVKYRPPSVYIILDNDAILESIRSIEYLMKNGINIFLVELPPNSDPSLLGFTKIWELIKKSNKMDFEELIKYKINL